MRDLGFVSFGQAENAALRSRPGKSHALQLLVPWAVAVSRVGLPACAHSRRLTAWLFDRNFLPFLRLQQRPQRTFLFGKFSFKKNLQMK